MTPQEEQAAMQAYVRQQLAFRQQPIGRENIPMPGLNYAQGDVVTPRGSLPAEYAPVAGDPSIPAMSTEPLGTGRGYTADIVQYLRDVISGKIAYEGVVGPGYQGSNRAFDIATGIAGSGIQGLKLLQKGLPIPEPIARQAPRIVGDTTFSPSYDSAFSEPRNKSN